MLYIQRVRLLALRITRNGQQYYAACKCLGCISRDEAKMRVMLNSESMHSLSLRAVQI